MVNTDTKQPKKQFIVQIKKTNALKLNKDGSYSYSFDTPFLFYVKEKVAESPAIVLIVELNTKKCFYKYLSDNYLMHLNFEDKDHITLRLNDCDQITDIDIFYNELLKIANERNARFINKTPQQIEKIRLAVEWLNRAMEDIPFLKELKVIPHEGEKFMPYWLELRTIKYADPKDIVIDYDEHIPSQYSEELDKKVYSKSIISTSSGIFPIELFETRMPFYNSIKVFLWQGIMESYKLDGTLHGVIVGNMMCSLF